MVANIAHRGARSVAPENTILAARRAFEIGADLWETDVAVTADQQLILMHDPLLLRTTDVAQCFPDREKMPVCRFRLPEIRRLDAGSWFLERDPFGQIEADQLSPDQMDACRGETIPTLEEALIFTLEHHWKINLELKPLPAKLNDYPIVTKVLELIDRLGMAADQVIISSFVHRWLREISARRPLLPIQALISGSADKPMNWGGFEFQTYNANHQFITEDQITKAHAEGKRINLFTVNEISDMKYYIEKDIEGLITDFPQQLKELLK